MAKKAKKTTKQAPKDRSPNYPAIGLSEAQVLLRQIWDKGKRTPMAREEIAKAFGKSLSGPTAVKISALAKYGLLERADSGMRVSDLAMRVLHGQPDDVQLALQQAAFKVSLVAELADTHADADADLLRSHLMLQRDFSEDGAAKFADVFRDIVEVANLSTEHKIEASNEIDKHDNSPSFGHISQMSSQRPIRESEKSAQMPQGSHRPISVLVGFDESGNAIYGHVAFDVPIRPGFLSRLGKQLEAMETGARHESSDH